MALTKEQRQYVINSKLTNKELALMYGEPVKIIGQIRTRAKQNEGKPKKIRTVFATKMTDSDIATIKENKYGTKELSEILGRSKSQISRIKSKFGLTRPKVKNGMAVKKEVVKPKVIEKPTYIPRAKSKFEDDNEQREKAMAISKRFELSDKGKIAAGTHEWVDLHPRGKALRRKTA